MIRCRRCQRVLRSPDSIRSGAGPKCLIQEARETMQRLVEPNEDNGNGRKRRSAPTLRAVVRHIPPVPELPRLVPLGTAEVGGIRRALLDAGFGEGDEVVIRRARKGKR